MKLFGKQVRTARQAYQKPRGKAGDLRKFSGPSYLTGNETLGTPSAYDAPVVYACVHKVSTTLATLPRKVRRVSDNSEATVPMWIERPNSYQGGADFVKAVTASLLLWGEAFILPTRNARGETVSAAVVNPQYVSHYSTSNYVIWHINGVQFEGELIHLRNDALPAKVRGVPIWTVMSDLSETNRVAQQFIFKVVEQGGAYQLAISFPDSVDVGDDVIEDTILQVMSRHAGPDGAYLPLVLSGGATVTPLNQSNADGQFLDLSDRTSKHIAQFWFGIDDSMLGFQSSQPNFYQNAPSVFYRYWLFACRHLHAELERAYTLMLPRNLYMDVDATENLMGGPHDRAKLALELTKVNQAWKKEIFTPDEVRHLTGKFPLPEYLPLTSTEMPVPVEGDQTQEPEEEEEDDDDSMETEDTDEMPDTSEEDDRMEE